MPNNTDALLAEWESSNRPLLIIDESRRDSGTDLGQLLVYSVIETTTKEAATIYQHALKVREKLKGQLKGKVFKGKDLMGTNKVLYAPMRRLCLVALASSIRVHLLLMSHKDVSEMVKTIKGGINAVPGPGETRPARRISGRELVPLLNLIKKIAFDAKYRDVVVDVLIDRSKQLGFGQKENYLADGEYDVLSGSRLNISATGAPTKIINECEFRLIPTTEKGSFKDLLLLPDAAAYLSLQKGDLAVAVSTLRAHGAYLNVVSGEALKSIIMK